VIPGKARREWQRELRWIGRALGRVRDCDVEIEHVKRMRSRSPEPERSALIVFANRLEIKRARRMAKLLDRLDSPRFLALKGLAQPWVEMRAHSSTLQNGDAPAYVAGPRIVAEWDRRMLDACAQAEQNPTAENVHALRIAIKHARYAVEYFADLEGPGATRRAKRLGRLQNMLGARQDAAVLLRHMRRYAETIPEEDRELLLGARSAIEKIDRAARVRKSELRRVLVLGAAT
jgi:CHAD domain-containing protein